MKHDDSCGIDTCGDGLSCNCLCHEIDALKKQINDAREEIRAASDELTRAVTEALQELRSRK